MVIKLQNYKNINTKAIQHYNSNAIVLLKCIILLKTHSSNIQRYGLSIYFSNSPKIIFFFTSLLTVYLLRFPCVKKRKKINFIFNYLPPCKIGLGRILEPINQVTVALIISSLDSESNDPKGYDFRHFQSRSTCMYFRGYLFEELIIHLINPNCKFMMKPIHLSKNMFLPNCITASQQT